ncbi:nonstructural protein [Precarious point virus]|uniref:Nonstructural protein n=1 Tax=Precarious point virus TaxID=487097 RepID=I1T361_9VIRU|nr:nonstructural protein [Precarious point virus]AEL29678.1 nonstructural protein [Precarious point virus]
MDYIKIKKEDLPPGVSPEPSLWQSKTIWQMMDSGRFPKVFHLCGVGFSVMENSLAWLILDEGIFTYLKDGLWYKQMVGEDPFLDCVGWPLERPRPLILNMYRYYKHGLVPQDKLAAMMKTIIGIILFGDQNPKKRKKEMKKISMGTAIFRTYQALRRQLERQDLCEDSVTGKNLLTDIVLVHALNMQDRFLKRSTVILKRIILAKKHGGAEGKTNKKEKKLKKGQLKFPFESDKENLLLPPHLVDLSEHFKAFPEARAQMLSTSWGPDWPAIQSL